jgi:hypothetical protein
VKLNNGGPSRIRADSAVHSRIGAVDGRRSMVSQRKLAELRTMGEVGQYVLGMIAGFSEAEIQRKREWTEAQLDQIRDAAVAWADD